MFITAAWMSPAGGYCPRVGPYAGQRSDGNLQKPAIRNRKLTSISTICEQVVSKVCLVAVTAGRLLLLRTNLTVRRLTKTVWTNAANKRGKSVQKLWTNLASTCHRISKTTVQSYIKTATRAESLLEVTAAGNIRNPRKKAAECLKHQKA